MSRVHAPAKNASRRTSADSRSTRLLQRSGRGTRRCCERARQHRVNRCASAGELVQGLRVGVAAAFIRLGEPFRGGPRSRPESVARGTPAPTTVAAALDFDEPGDDGTPPRSPDSTVMTSSARRGAVESANVSVRTLARSIFGVHPGPDEGMFYEVWAKAEWVPGWLPALNAASLYRIMREARPRSILEIGSYQGQSTALFD